MKINSLFCFLIIFATICLIGGYYFTYGSAFKFLQLKKPEQVIHFNEFKSGLTFKKYNINKNNFAMLLSGTKEEKSKLFNDGSYLGDLFDSENNRYSCYKLKDNRIILARNNQKYPPECVYELDSLTSQEILEMFSRGVQAGKTARGKTEGEDGDSLRK
jgi:hypothetical protein